MVLSAAVRISRCPMRLDLIYAEDGTSFRDIEEEHSTEA